MTTSQPPPSRADRRDEAVQPRHGGHHLLDRHVRVDAVLVEEVDVVETEPLQRRLHDLGDMRRPAVDARHLAVLDPEAELGGHDCALAPALQGAAQQQLVRERTVDFRRVE